MSIYSFVNAATLARDLARHPYGAAVADELLRAFGLDDDDLADLDWVPTPPGTVQLRAHAHKHAANPPATTAGGASAGGASVGLLDVATIGDAEDLCRWVRGDVLAHSWRRADGLATCRWPTAVAHVCDGVLAAWAGPSVATEFGRAWQDWVTGRAPTRINDPSLARIVSALEAAEPAALDDVADEMTRWRASGRSWPAAMHDAAWAIDVTGRARTSAAAQVAAVRAVLRVANSPRPDFVAAVSMAVQATVVADVLPDHAVAAMCRPLFAHLPPGPPANVQSHGRDDG